MSKVLLGLDNPADGSRGEAAAPHMYKVYTYIMYTVVCIYTYCVCTRMFAQLHMLFK